MLKTMARIGGPSSSMGVPMKQSLSNRQHCKHKAIRITTDGCCSITVANANETLFMAATDVYKIFGLDVLVECSRRSGTKDAAFYSLDLVVECKLCCRSAQKLGDSVVQDLQTLLTTKPIKKHWVKDMLNPAILAKLATT
jgi:hypothetical protein